jgi:hypothetical protein
MPCSPTPAGPLRQTIGRSALLLQRNGIAFRGYQSVGSRHGTFGAHSHGLPACCVRFAVVVADAHATLASGWWSSLAGRDSNPLDPM